MRTGDEKFCLMFGDDPADMVMVLNEMTIFNAGIFGSSAQGFLDHEYRKSLIRGTNEPVNRVAEFMGYCFKADAVDAAIDQLMWSRENIGPVMRTTWMTGLQDWLRDWVVAEGIGAVTAWFYDRDILFNVREFLDWKDGSWGAKSPELAEYEDLLVKLVKAKSLKKAREIKSQLDSCIENVREIPNETIENCERKAA